MNTKKLIGTSMVALLVVALSVSMAAAAAQVDMPLDITNQLDGIDVTDVTVTVTITTTGARSIVLDTNNSALYARLQGNGIDTGWVSDEGNTTAYTALTAGDYVYTLSVRGTAAGRVSVADYLGPTEPTFSSFANCDVGYGTSDVNKIPEFTTLAIPVVALLGLVLFMRRKKD